MVLDLDHARLQGLAQLRCRQPDPRRIAHRVGEIVEQPMEVLAETVDRLALQAQAWITEENDRADAHLAEYIEALDQLRSVGGSVSAWAPSPSVGGSGVAPPDTAWPGSVSPANVAASTRGARCGGRRSSRKTSVTGNLISSS